MKQIISFDFIEAFFIHLEEIYAEEIAGYSKGFDLMSLFNQKHIGIRKFADDYIAVAIEQMEEADPNCEKSPEFQQLLKAEKTTTDDSEHLINSMTIHDTFTKEAGPLFDPGMACPAMVTLGAMGWHGPHGGAVLREAQGKHIPCHLRRRQ